MPTTVRSDIVVPELLEQAIEGAFLGRTLLFGTGAVVRSNTLPGNKKGGDTVTIPYFSTLGDAETLAEGDALTPEKITESKETNVVIRIGKAFETTMWAQWAAAGDPYKEASRQIDIIIARAQDQALIDRATAALPTAYVWDITGTPGATLNFDVITDAAGIWGDQQDDVVLLGVHSKVFRDLRKLKDSTGRPLLVDPEFSPLPLGRPAPATIWGIPIVVSDKCKVISGTPNQYESLLIKRSALALWEMQAPVVKTGDDILAHTEILAVHHYFATHRYLRVQGSTHPGVIKIKHF
jgi:HK97 family phage major capsid protein